jgi:hypothetical protein
MVCTCISETVKFNSFSVYLTNTMQSNQAAWYVFNWQRIGQTIYNTACRRSMHWVMMFYSITVLICNRRFLTSGKVWHCIVCQMDGHVSHSRNSSFLVRVVSPFLCRFIRSPVSRRPSEYHTCVACSFLRVFPRFTQRPQVNALAGCQLSTRPSGIHSA